MDEELSNEMGDGITYTAGVLKCFQLWAKFHIRIFLLTHHYEGYKWINTL